MGLKELVPAGKLFLADRNLFQEREQNRRFSQRKQQRA